MTIVILETRIDSGAMQGVPDTRAVTLWITNGTTNYITQRGNLPLTGDLLPALVADEANIWNDAVAGGAGSDEGGDGGGGARTVAYRQPRGKSYL